MVMTGSAGTVRDTSRSASAATRCPVRGQRHRVGAAGQSEAPADSSQLLGVVDDPPQIEHAAVVQRRLERSGQRESLLAGPDCAGQGPLGLTSLVPVVGGRHEVVVELLGPRSVPGLPVVWEQGLNHRLAEQRVMEPHRLGAVARFHDTGADRVAERVGHGPTV